MKNKIISFLLGLCLVGGQLTETTSVGSVLALLSPYLSQASERALSRNVTGQAYSKRSGDSLSGFNRLIPDPDIALAVIPYSRAKGLPVNFPFCDCRRCENHGNPSSTRGHDYDHDRGRPADNFADVDGGNFRSYRSNHDSSSGKKAPRPVGTSDGNSDGTSTPFPRTGSTIYSRNRINSDFLDNGRYHPTTSRPVISKDVRFRYPEVFNLNSN